MEETGEDKIGSVLSWLQAGARGKASRMQFKKLQDQKLALYACQCAIRSNMMAKTWMWMQILLAIKPNLKCTQFDKYKKLAEDKIAIAEANTDKAMAECNAVIAVHEKLSAEKNELVTSKNQLMLPMHVSRLKIRAILLIQMLRRMNNIHHLQSHHHLILKVKPSMGFSKQALKWSLRKHA
jgi:myosin heavy subunit